MDLSLATADELWNELKGRYLGVLLVSEAGDLGPTKANFDIRYSGGMTMAYGLAVRGFQAIKMGDLVQEEVDEEDEP